MKQDTYWTLVACLAVFISGAALAEDTATGTIKPLLTVKFSPDKDVQCLSSAIESGDPFCHRWSGIESGECLLPVNKNSVAIGGEADMPRPRRRINPARMTQHRRLRTFAAQKCVHGRAVLV